MTHSSSLCTSVKSSAMPLCVLLPSRPLQRTETGFWGTAQKKGQCRIYLSWCKHAEEEGFLKPAGHRLPCCISDGLCTRQTTILQPMPNVTASPISLFHRLWDPVTVGQCEVPFCLVFCDQDQTRAVRKTTCTSPGSKQVQTEQFFMEALMPPVDEDRLGSSKGEAVAGWPHELHSFPNCTVNPRMREFIYTYNRYVFPIVFDAMYTWEMTVPIFMRILDRGEVKPIRNLFFHLSKTKNYSYLAQVH